MTRGILFLRLGEAPPLDRPGTEIRRRCLRASSARKFSVTKRTADQAELERECDFRNVPEDELQPCCWYEYFRESATMRQTRLGEQHALVPKTPSILHPSVQRNAVRHGGRQQQRCLARRNPFLQNNP